MEDNKLINNIQFMSFGRKEIGIPAATERITNVYEWIPLGVKNDFPFEILRLYENSSGRFKALIDRKVDIIASKGFKDVPGLAELIKNEWIGEDLNEVAYKCTFDFVLFGGYYLNILWSREKKPTIAGIKHIPYEKVRCSKPIDERGVMGYFISRDWARWRREECKPEFYHRFDESCAKEYPSQIIQFKQYSPGREFYPLPSYNPAMNWIKLDYEISTFHLKSVQNGLMPSMVIINKTGIPTAEQREQAYQAIKERYAGSDNAGDFLMLFGEGGDKTPEFVPLQLAATDQRFKDLKVQINEELMVAMKFTAAVAGIEVEGKLGGRNEIEEQFEYLQTTVIEPIQNFIQRSFDKFAEVNGITDKFEFNRYVMFAPDSSDQATIISNNLNALTPQVAALVMEQMTPEEIRSLVGLGPTQNIEPSTEDNTL